MGKNQIVSISKNGSTLFGVVAQNGQQIIPCDYTSITDNVCNGRCSYIVNKLNSWGIIADDGRVILQCFYDSISPLPNLNKSFPQYLIVKRNGLYGIYDIIKEDFEIECLAKEITASGNTLSIRYPKTLLWGLMKWSSTEKVKLPF